MMGTGSNGSVSGQAGIGAYCPANTVNGTGFRVLTYDGANFTTYKNTVAASAGIGSQTWQQPGTVTLFNCAGNFPFEGRLSFGFVGESLNSTEQAALYSAIQAFQTSLNRNL